MGQPGALRITVSQDPPGIAVAGDIDFASVKEFDGALQKAITEFPGDFHVDLSQVEFIDLEGLRTLVQASQAVGEEGRQLIVTQMPSHLREVLRIVAWSETITHIDNRKDS